jgi:hypothetical protein
MKDSIISILSIAIHSKLARETLCMKDSIILIPSVAIHSKMARD